MILKGTCLKVADNTGAVLVRCIGVYNRKIAAVGDIITVSVLRCVPHKKVRRREVHRALVVRTIRNNKTKFGFSGSFKDNAVVLLKRNELTPLGTRVIGYVSSTLRYKGFSRLLALSSGIL
jgi:large subunit ribosomal protein L14